MQIQSYPYVGCIPSKNAQFQCNFIQYPYSCMCLNWTNIFYLSLQSEGYGHYQLAYTPNTMHTAGKSSMTSPHLQMDCHVATRQTIHRVRWECPAPSKVGLGKVMWSTFCSRWNPCFEANYYGRQWGKLKGRTKVVRQAYLSSTPYPKPSTITSGYIKYLVQW